MIVVDPSRLINVDNSNCFALFSSLNLGPWYNGYGLGDRYLKWRACGSNGGNLYLFFRWLFSRRCNGLGNNALVYKDSGLGGSRSFL